MTISPHPTVAKAAIAALAASVFGYDPADAIEAADRICVNNEVIPSFSELCKRLQDEG